MDMETSSDFQAWVNLGKSPVSVGLFFDVLKVQNLGSWFPLISPFLLSRNLCKTCWFKTNYPLVNLYKKLWNITMFNGSFNYKWPFSIAMFVYQRVNDKKWLCLKKCGTTWNNPKMQCVIRRYKSMLSMNTCPFLGSWKWHVIYQPIFRQTWRLPCSSLDDQSHLCWCINRGIIR